MEIQKLGHDLVHHEAKAVTCTECGWDAYDTCSRCDYTTYVEIQKLGHDLVHHEAKAATCTASGWDAYDTCSRCDYSTFKELPALGHKFSTEWSFDGAAHWHFCLNEGCDSVFGKEDHSIENGLCSICGYKEYIVGDLDENSLVDINDAIYILYYTFFPEDYPLNQNADFDGNGVIDINDAIYVLYYTFFPEDYPLNRGTLTGRSSNTAADPSLAIHA